MKQYLGIFIGASLAIAFSVFAFTEPSQAPPGGNVAAPINVSGTAQTKAGDLTVNHLITGDQLWPSGGDFGSWFGSNEYRSWIGKCPDARCGGYARLGQNYLHISGWTNANYGTSNGQTNRVISLHDVVVIPNGPLGVGTTNPYRAPFETAGMVGNTLALFGQGAQGMSLIANWPGIAFNSYFGSDGKWRSISSGWSGDIAFFQDISGTGGFVFRTGERASGSDQVVAHKDVLQINNDGTTIMKGPAIETSGKLCVNGPCRGGIMFQVNNGHMLWGNNSLLATDQGGAIELGGDNTTPGAGIPYIDFHQAGITQDFNARIINDANGKLTLEAPTLYASNNINANDVFIRASGKWASQMGGGDTINGRKVHVPVQSTGFGDVGNDMGNTVRVNLWGFFDSDSFQRAACPQGYYMVGVGINGGSCPAMFCFEEIICRKLYD